MMAVLAMMAVVEVLATMAVVEVLATMAVVEVLVMAYDRQRQWRYRLRRRRWRSIYIGGSGDVDYNGGDRV